MDEATILTNAYDAKKSYGRGKRSNYGGNGKSNPKYCINCHKYGYTIYFFYQKYGHPQFNKPSSSANTCNTTTTEKSFHNGWKKDTTMSDQPL